MIRPLLIALFSITCIAQSQVKFRYSLTGTPYGWRGYDAWYHISTSWIDALPATVDPATDMFTVPGHNFVQTSTLSVASESTLPTGMGSKAFRACLMDPNGRFRLMNYAISGTCPLSHDSTLVQVSNGGANLWIGPTRPHGQAIGGVRPYAIVRPPQLPAGVTVTEVLAGNALPTFTVPATQGGGWRGYSNAPDNFYVHLQVAPNAPLTETGQIVWTIVDNNDVTYTVTRPFRVRQLPSFTINRPTSFPMVPNKPNWELQMLDRAHQWCDPQSGQVFTAPNGTSLPRYFQRWGVFGIPSQVWFYDGAWVYSQVATYTGDARWTSCSTMLANAYRDAVMPSGAVLYALFTDGLKAQQYLDAVRRLAGMDLNGGPVSDTSMRESSYQLEAYINYVRALGYQQYSQIPPTTSDTVLAKARRFMPVFATRLMGMLAMQRTPYFDYQETFMNGLAMRALILWWEISSDPRVPIEVKEELDWIWVNAQVNGKLKYSVPPKGPQCDYNCGLAMAALNNLVVPGYAWYWSISRDETIRQRGDVIWEHALDDDITYYGKFFSQNYRWSFDYVLWREGRLPYRP